MKKGICLFLLIFLFGCSNSQNTDDPQIVLNSVIDEKYRNAEILKQQEDNDLYLAMVDNEDVVSLIILKHEGKSYEYFGGASYNIEKDDYGKFEFGADDNLIIVFAKNNKFETLMLNYKSMKYQDRTLSIQEDIKNNDNYINVYSFSEEYSLEQIELQ